MVNAQRQCITPVRVYNVELSESPKHPSPKLHSVYTKGLTSDPPWLDKAKPLYPPDMSM